MSGHVRCFKCQQEPGVASSRDGPSRPYCAQCFVNYVESLLRDVVYRRCALPSERDVAVAVSGSASSAAILSILAAVRDENAARGGIGKIQYSFHAFHLDESSLCGDDATRRAAVVRQLCDSFGVALTVLPLDRLIDRSLSDIVCPTGAADGRHTELSAVEDAYTLAKRGAILNAACAMGADALVFGGSAESCAWRGLSEIVRGRGRGVRDISGYHGTLYVGPGKRITVYRAARGLLAKELILYCRLKGLSVAGPVLPPCLIHASRRTIDGVLQDFVYHLNVNFRSTVFNVLKAIDAAGVNTTLNLVRGSSTVTTPEGGRKALKRHLHDTVMTSLEAQEDARTAAGSRPCVVCRENAIIARDGTSCCGCSRVVAMSSGPPPQWHDVAATQCSPLLTALLLPVAAQLHPPHPDEA